MQGLDGTEAYTRAGNLQVGADGTLQLPNGLPVLSDGGAPIVVRPFATVSRTSATASLDQWTIHSGPIGFFDDGVDFGTDYDDIAAAGTLRQRVDAVVGARQRAS